VIVRWIDEEGAGMSTPHDELFKRTFERAGDAKALLRSLLPAALVRAVDWRTLRIESGALLPREGNERRSDLLFSARFRQSRRRVYLLVEHASRSTRRLLLRIFGYVSHLLDRVLEGERGVLRVPMVVPVVVCNARRGWTAPKSLRGLTHPDPVRMGVGGPDVSVIVDDLVERSDADLRARRLSARGRLTLWLLRDGRDLAVLWEAMPRWADVLREAALARDRDETFAHLSRYVSELHPSKVSFEQFHAKLIELVPEAEEPMMTYLERLRREGIKQGLEQGLAQGLEQGLEQGRVEALRESLLLQLREKFSRVQAAHERRIAGADVGQLREWLARIVRVDTIDAVFAP
jgi:predicted transposase YdaD